MKITAVRATPVNIPLEAPYCWSYGTLPGFTQTIIEVVTDDGLTGIGEAPGAEAAIIIKKFARALVGRDPVDIKGAQRVCLPAQRGVQSITDYQTITAFGGIEIALWDIRGKAWGRPVYDLLGGPARTEIAFTDYFAFRPRLGDAGGESTAEEVADYCVELKEKHGTTFFEGKVSEVDPDASIQLVETLRRKLGETVMIRIDSNHAYSVAAARMMAPAFEELGVANWEDPVGTWEEMARLRPHTRLRLSSHNIDIPRTVSLGVPDALVTNIACHGGFLGAMNFVAACKVFGLDFWCYSGDSGIQTAAYMHLCAANSWIREPSQSLLRMQPLDVIEEGPFRPRNNLVSVPNGPGLGVTLSAEKLAAAHELFLRDGPMNKYHDPAAPGTFRRLPLA